MEKAKHNRMRRGSVLMEFVLVLPIYILLFGGAFMLGDMVVHGVRMPSADRTYAFDHARDDTGEGEAVVREALFPATEVTDDKTPRNAVSEATNSVFYADTAIAGPFSARVATTVRDRYQLPAGGARAHLSFVTWFFDQLGAQENVSPAITNLFAKGGTIELYGKPSDTVRAYNYYTLKRHQYGATAYTWRDHNRAASDLLTQKDKGLPVWQAVSGEERFGTESDLDSNTPSVTKSLGTAARYERFADFKTWSD